MNEVTIYKTTTKSGVQETDANLTRLFGLYKDRLGSEITHEQFVKDALTPTFQAMLRMKIEVEPDVLTALKDSDTRKRHARQEAVSATKSYQELVVAAIAAGTPVNHILSTVELNTKALEKWCDNSNLINPVLKNEVRKACQQWRADALKRQARAKASKKLQK